MPNEAVSEANKKRWKAYKEEKLKDPLLCCVPGCGEPESAKKKCRKHYMKEYAALRRAALSQDPLWLEKEQARQREVKTRQRRALTSRQREEALDRSRWHQTGVSGEHRETLRDLQGGLCAICPRELGPGRHTCCDHFETVDGVRVKTTRKGGTKKHPRALLCLSCNSALGFYEAPNGMRAAGLRIEVFEAYLAAHGTVHFV